MLTVAIKNSNGEFLSGLKLLITIGSVFSVLYFIICLRTMLMAYSRRRTEGKNVTIDADTILLNYLSWSLDHIIGLEIEKDQRGKSTLIYATLECRTRVVVVPFHIAFLFPCQYLNRPAKYFGTILKSKKHVLSLKTLFIVIFPYCQYLPIPESCI